MDTPTPAASPDVAPTWTERIAQWRWFRLTASILVGSALFVLGVIYLNMTRLPDQPGFVVVGGTQAFAGRSMAVRVSARGLDSMSPYPVQVDAVRIDGESLKFTAGDSDPTIVRWVVPSALAADQAKVEVDVVSDGHEATLVHQLAVVQPVPTEASTGDPAAKRVAGKGKTRIDVIPEATVLAMGMENRVLIRVRDSQGNALKDAPVWVEHPRCLVPPGKHRFTTDAMGLIEVKVIANAPSVDLKIGVMPTGEPLTEIIEPMRPLGRQMLLSTENPVFRPGEPLKAHLKTWRPRAVVHCDLIEDGAVLWSGTVASGKTGTSVEPPTTCVGLCHLQCSGHPWEPGDEFASIPLVVTSDDTLTALTDLVRSRNLLHPNSLKIRPGADPQRTARYFLTFLQRSAFSPALWINTLETDRAARAEVATAGKQRVLIAIGVVFLLIILVVADILIRNTAAQRQRMRLFASETLGEDIDDDLALAPDSRLDRTRGTLLLIAMAGALVANLVGIIWLLALVGET